jgi:hypothetical protein
MKHDEPIIERHMDIGLDPVGAVFACFRERGERVLGYQASRSALCEIDSGRDLRNAALAPRWPHVSILRPCPSLTRRSRAFSSSLSRKSTSSAGPVKVNGSVLSFDGDEGTVVLALEKPEVMGSKAESAGDAELVLVAESAGERA